MGVGAAIFRVCQIAIEVQKQMGGKVSFDMDSYSVDTLREATPDVLILS